MELTIEQKDFLAKLLQQINVSAANPEAAKTVDLVQSILKELQK